jgi:hypothetical protein
MAVSNSVFNFMIVIDISKAFNVTDRNYGDE